MYREAVQKTAAEPPHPSSTIRAQTPIALPMRSGSLSDTGSLISASLMTRKHDIACGNLSS